jgi:mono/diheme cytochrome c family protein
MRSFFQPPFAAPAGLLLSLLLWLVSCTSQPYTDGERLYQTNCANCHLDDGKGLGALIPPLAGSDHLASQAERLPCIIRYGLSDTIVVNGKTYAEMMPGVPALSDIEVTNLSNYVLHRWSPGRRPLSLEEGRAVLEKCRR